MKANLKKKPRESSLTVLKRIDRRLELISKQQIAPSIAVADEPTELAAMNSGARFVKLDAHGKALPASAKSWSAVRDLKLGLDWMADDYGTLKWAEAKEACAKLSFCGTKNWRLPTVEELFLLADRSRRDPAIDTAFFPSCKGGYYWASTPFAGDSDYAWLVGFGNGFSSWSNVGYGYLVRPCRPSQEL